MKHDIRETAAAKALSAWIILDKRGNYVATVRSHYSSGGTVTVNVWQSDAAAARSQAAAEKAGDKIPAAPGKYVGPFDYQADRASGGGYDKHTSAMAGMWIDGHRLVDHCGESAKLPKAGFFPANYKPKPGYSLANYGQFDRVTGKRLSNYHWTDKAREELGEGAEWAAINSRSLELERAADLVSGYSSCHRLPGLRYLEAIGYRIHQAI